MDDRKSAGSRAKAMQLTRETLDAFKRACPENEQIAGIIRRRFFRWIDAPVADIGAGRGDIALEAFPELDAVLVDRLNFADYPIAAKHRRVQRDVFSMSRAELGQPKTLILSHVFQYLDDDTNALADLLDRVQARKLVVVLNKNVDILARFIDWSSGQFPDANPEVDIDSVNDRYVRVDEEPFSASIYGSNRADLARSLLHLVDVAETNANIERVAGFLRGEGLSIKFTFDQVVRAYERRP